MKEPMEPGQIIWDDCPPGWREEARLAALWQAYYMALGMSRFRAQAIGRAKAAKGKRPPLRTVQ